MLIVQCDFDDTITVGNVSTLIRDTFGPEGWLAMEEDYHSGKFSVEQSNIRQFALIKVTQGQIEDLVRSQVAAREGFVEFVESCLRTGIRLVIVSSGLDLYIKPTLDRLGLSDLEFHSGKAHVTPDGIELEYTDAYGSSMTKGLKESYTRKFKEAGHTVIYVGDGLSDIQPAQEADFVIARSTLEKHLRAKNAPHYSFSTFDDVHARVKEIRRIADV